jgi:glycosyltransferase involved in cell wall biosynthesis
VIAAAEPRSWFVLCGDGVTTDNGELIASLREAGVLERTRLLGRRGDVGRVLSALDVFTLSSLSEGFPNALGEAMACGVPCVTTDVGDCGWILGDAGRTVPARAPGALASAWLDVLCLDTAGRAALGARGRARVAADFSIETIAARYRDLHRRVAYGVR